MRRLRGHVLEHRPRAAASRVSAPNRAAELQNQSTAPHCSVHYNSVVHSHRDASLHILAYTHYMIGALLLMHIRARMRQARSLIAANALRELLICCRRRSGGAASARTMARLQPRFIVSTACLRSRDAVRRCPRPRPSPMSPSTVPGEFGWHWFNVNSF